MLLEARVVQPVTEAEAVRVARELYGLEAWAQAFPGEYDDNFHLRTSDSHAYVLKVMHPAREQSFIDMQCRALVHLAERAPHLCLPRVVRHLKGELFASIPGAEGSARLVWLLTFVEGRVLAEVRPHSPELLGNLGRFLGELDTALQTFSHPAAHRELKWDPLPAAAAIVAGYHGAFPLDELELSVLYALVGARLAVSVTNSAHRKTVKPDDPYVTVSEAPAWEALEQLGKIHPRFAHYTFRAACGLPPVPQGEKIKRWLRANAGSASSILESDLRTAPTVVFDLSVGSTFLGADPNAAVTPAVTEKIFHEIRRAGAVAGIGRYDEVRLVYTSPLFGASGNPTDERRTIHLGIDLFVEPGTPIRAPLDGVVHILANNSAPLDYGPLVILRHEIGEGEEFFTLYGHLTKDTLSGLRVGQRIARGENFARVGATSENGGWAPHVHFQIILDLLELGADFPGVAYASQRTVWTSLSPDPNLLLGIPADRFPAKELALRLARAHTGREDIIVLEHAYHGHTNTLIDISPYKFDGPGGRGKKPWVHVAPLPDDYRGAYRRGDKEAGAKYARHVAEILERTEAGGHGVAAYIAETLPSVGGQIVFPPGYLAEVYCHVRAAGAICIADEVQVGFGRLGTHFWGFETQEVVPDIVVLGKPIGNAFPLAAVVTTKEIAASFANGMEFFSTFGGNPVASAAGLAVLEVLREEKLQENALRVGTHLKNRLQELQHRHALVGDVRGWGLFLGVDLVLDRATREPAPLQASYVVNRLRDCGILTGTDGPHHNVIKLRPPLPFTEMDADLFVATLGVILEEDAAEPRH